MCGARRGAVRLMSLSYPGKERRRDVSCVEWWLFDTETPTGRAGSSERTVVAISWERYIRVRGFVLLSSFGAERCARMCREGLGRLESPCTVCLWERQLLVMIKNRWERQLWK